MTLLDRLFRPSPDPRDALRPLWDAVIAAAREPAWYAEAGVADSVEGRFDMVVLVLAAVLLRLERGGEGLAGARLTEWFVEDMDGQLRQSGVGDLVVGKHVGKLMATLGGRIGALREALPAGGAALAQAIERNTTLVPAAGPEAVAERIARLHARLEAMPMPELLAGRLG
jgi:cytochrome b pre-mRNA-processing protein 3